MPGLASKIERPEDEVETITPPNPKEMSRMERALLYEMHVGRQQQTEAWQALADRVAKRDDAEAERHAEIVDALASIREAVNVHDANDAGRVGALGQMFAAPAVRENGATYTPTTEDDRAIGRTARIVVTGITKSTGFQRTAASFGGVLGGGFLLLLIAVKTGIIPSADTLIAVAKAFQAASAAAPTPPAVAP